MHELSIAMSLIDIAREEARRRNAQRVLAVHVRVGPMAGVVVEALESAFEVARAGSDLADSRLVVETPPLTARCPACERTTDVRSISEMQCAECGSPVSDLVTGRELEMTAMEIDE